MAVMNLLVERRRTYINSPRTDTRSGVWSQRYGASVLQMRPFSANQIRSPLSAFRMT